MASPLDILTGPPGVPGGGPKVDVTTKSAAQSSLDSSGSYYSLGGNSTGDFIVGGTKGLSPVMLGVIGLAAVVLWKYLK